MTTTRTDPEPPYLVEMDDPNLPYRRSHYMSISFYPSRQDMSPDELRLEHYNACRGKLTFTLPSDHPTTLMATRQLHALSTTQPLKVIRAFADGFCKLNGGVVVFLVGTETPKRFNVHEGLIKPRSEFVRLALRGEWKEAQERIIPLPEDDPDVFSVYQQWLYRSLVYTRHNNGVSIPDDEYRTLVRAYILGEKFMDQDFKDAIADAIVEKLRTLRRFDSGLTDLVFDNTPSTSPLRRLWMDAYYYFGSPEWLDATLVGSPINAEFMVEFSRYQMDSRTGFRSFGPSAMFLCCTYHGHGIRPCHRHFVRSPG